MPTVVFQDFLTYNFITIIPNTPSASTSGVWSKPDLTVYKTAVNTVPIPKHQILIKLSFKKKKNRYRNRHSQFHGILLPITYYLSQGDMSIKTCTKSKQWERREGVTKGTFENTI